MKNLNLIKNKVFPKFLSQLAKDLTKFYIQKLDKPFKIQNKLKGKGYDPVTTADKAFEKFIRAKIQKKFPNHQYIGVDKSEIAIKTAKKNRDSLGLKNVQFFNQDIFKYNQSKADLLLCNPPYLAKDEIESLEQSVKDYDPLSALTDFKNGTSFYKYLISNFNKLIKKNGIMLLEIPFSAVTDDIIAINTDFNTNKSFFYKDLEGKNRVIKIY